MLLYINGLDYFDRTTLVLNGGKFENWRSDNSTDITLSEDYARTGGSGIRFVTNSNTNGQKGSSTVHLGDDYETLIVGAAVRLDSDNQSSALENVIDGQEVIIFSFMDGDEEQVSLCFSPSMRLTVRNDTRGTLLARSTKYFHQGVYYYIEFESLISNTVGTYKVRVDGIEILTGTADTQTSDEATANGVRFGISKTEGSNNAGRFLKFDDIYIAANVVATTYNTFVGDIRVEGLRAAGETTVHQWEPTSGTLHYDMIDDVAPDTTQVLANGTIGNTTTFVFNNPATPAGSIIAISPNIYARKTKAGVVRIASVLHAGGDITVGTESYLGQEYQYHYPDVWTRHPASSAQWPFSISGSIAFGVRRTG